MAELVVVDRDEDAARAQDHSVAVARSTYAYCRANIPMAVDRYRAADATAQKIHVKYQAACDAHFAADTIEDWASLVVYSCDLYKAYTKSQHKVAEARRQVHRLANGIEKARRIMAQKGAQQ